MGKYMRSVSVWERDAVKRTFTDVESAARFLLEGWPDVERTEIHGAARQAALDAVTGAGFPERFRAAFVAAAKEAGILA
ncbi:hypothetical protein J2X65_000022 [Ancylobacter sp. 3268]|uniref:DUF982 domain-containing protein n=1 Tax=Ancylobacter sp. 3268 TaxID=2817752 RepID=UPI00285552C0|nr:DUF982 domain-containing protein [Ancylobacter sp. 3268]MDR6950679.1 hypothetical protein [Ancylobacter sp. 3268]